MLRKELEDGTIVLTQWELLTQTTKGYYGALDIQQIFDTKLAMMEYATRPSTVTKYKKHGIIAVSYQKTVRTVDTEVPIII